MSRENWLAQVGQYSENTESPRRFWFWAGLSAIAGALQRKVWLQFGTERIFPNLYVMIVAVPGKYRKAAPVGFTRKVLRASGFEVFADSPTKRAMTKKMDELGKTQWFRWTQPNGEKKIEVHSSLTLVSRELSSLLAIEPKAMIEALTDLYDSHDEWEYETSGKGKDKLVGVCVNMIVASTPRWISNNLPEDAIGGGFTRRLSIIYENAVYKDVPIPPEPPKALWDKLVEELGRIGSLKGPFEWTPEARQLYVSWYSNREKFAKSLKDERVVINVWTAHVQILKVAMCLQVAGSDKLVLTEACMRRAIDLVEEYLRTASHAFAGQGSGALSTLIYRVLQQVKQLRSTSIGELLRLNWNHATKRELDQVIETLEGMGNIKIIYDAKAGSSKVMWVGGGKGNL